MDDTLADDQAQQPDDEHPALLDVLYEGVRRNLEGKVRGGGVNAPFCESTGTALTNYYLLRVSLAVEPLPDVMLDENLLGGFTREVGEA